LKRKKKSTIRRPARAGRARRLWWSDLSDEQLLDVRMCDLDLRLEGTRVADCVQRVYEDLQNRGLTLNPHVWLSSEWFSPDGVPGIAVPFYLAHPRLMKLEEKQILEVEGGTTSSCLRILRHEAGHCLDTAYRLHRRKRWREVFGSYAQPYPQTYRPKPGSRKYVLHLDWWYAQSHPAEDFAETFAVWLSPHSRWRQAYHGWPAIRKIEYVDELMGEIAGTAAAVRCRRHVEPMSELRKTLRQHYREKKQRYLDEWPEFYDSELRKLFSDDKRHVNRPTAASFLRRMRPELRETVASWTGTHPYTIDQVLRDMIDRCKELHLRLAQPERQARIEAMIMLTVQTMNYIHSGHYRVAL
jgi:hypothetical protein